jgi:hypothetical protein
MIMQTEEQDRLKDLEVGQLWKLEHGYLYIAELGRRLVHYKMLRHPNQTAALTRLIGVDALLKYLSHCEAELVG